MPGSLRGSPCASPGRRASAAGRVAQALGDRLDQAVELAGNRLQVTPARGQLLVAAGAQPVDLLVEAGDERLHLLGLHQPVAQAAEDQSLEVAALQVLAVGAVTLAVRTRASDVVTVDTGVGRATGAATDQPSRRVLRPALPGPLRSRRPTAVVRIPSATGQRPTALQCLAGRIGDQDVGLHVPVAAARPCDGKPARRDAFASGGAPLVVRHHSIAQVGYGEPVTLRSLEPDDHKGDGLGCAKSLHAPTGPRAANR